MVDPFDVAENVSLIDEGNSVTLIVDDSEVEMDAKVIPLVRDWFKGWCEEHPENDG